MARWMWRQLTSMRVALFLLLLLAVAALPGSVFPQRSVDASRVEDYLRDSPQVGAWLDRLGLFDVYTSAWFSAIYLLLLVSLVGCIVPRTQQHWRASRIPPPRAPQRLDRLPVHLIRRVGMPADQVEAALRATLRSRRYRLRTDQPPGVISAEVGYLREVGNLLFHLAILTLTVALAWGYLLGWRADRIVVVGSPGFSNTASDYDTFAPGPWVDPTALQPFSVRVDALDVRFESAPGAQFGAPRDFVAGTTVWTPGNQPRQQTLAVNAPLNFGGASVYLLGNGYAPRVSVRDASGRLLYRQATPFLPQDGMYRSLGAIKVPAAAPQQWGFTGLLLPTAFEGPSGPDSAFPDLRRPALLLTMFEGRLSPSGRSQSVYALDTTALRQLSDAQGQPLRLWLTPGQTVDLPGGRGTISLDGIDRWAGVSTRYDPAKPLALGSALVALTGLVASLLIRRRRVFVRITDTGASEGPGPACLVSLGAIGKGEDPMLGDAVSRLVTRALGSGQERNAGS
ncbi:MAG TPA: cytochrome c biogenesis protein ResB [Dermatophilaceae bacterium]|nr:cytochrome c biogenesis protein ResB [Dermatophilaceae bacterium]